MPRGHRSFQSHHSEIGQLLFGAMTFFILFPAPAGTGIIPAYLLFLAHRRRLLPECPVSHRDASPESRRGGFVLPDGNTRLIGVGVVEGLERRCLDHFRLLRFPDRPEDLNHVFPNLPHEGFEEIEPFPLVLHKRIFLPVSPESDPFLEAIDLEKVVLPEVVQRLQGHVTDDGLEGFVPEFLFPAGQKLLIPGNGMIQQGINSEIPELVDI